jgi:gamma-glutamyltranspeptidase/glutathione hydrolase
LCRQLWRELVVLTLAATLVACSSNSKQEEVARTFAGAAVGDEPRAVLEARTILAADGNAADAAVAMYFALAASLPASASLGSGGVCVVFDAPGGKVEALDFTARSPRAIPAGADRPSAVPGSPMGFSVLHARYGRLPWGQLISPGERIANFGVPASRMLVSDMAPVAAPLLEDPESRRVFADASGAPIVEGATFRQPDLARVLQAIRIKGAEEMYRGSLAAPLVAAAKAAGGTLELSDLAEFRPQWLPTVQLNYTTRRVAHFAPPPADAGLVEAQMMAMLDARGFGNAGEADRQHMLAEVAERAYSERTRWLRPDFSSGEDSKLLLSSERVSSLLSTYDSNRHTDPLTLNPPPVARPENPAATSFAVVDRTGSAVACTLTMNNNFGTGRMARGMGILLAAVPNQQGRGPLSLGPVVVVNLATKTLHFAAGAAGGVAAPTALVNVMARTILADQPLDTAIRSRRIHHGGAPDTTYYEPGFSREEIAALAARGHKVAATPVLGLVNAISCPDGMPRNPNQCSIATDPRGFGLAMPVSK